MSSSTPVGTLSDLDASGLYELILETSGTINFTLSITEVFDKFAQALQKLVELDRANICFIDEDAGTVTIYCSWGDEMPGRYPGLARPLAGTRAERLLATRQTIMDADITAGNPETPPSDAALRSGLRSSIAVPLFSSARVTGSLSLRSRRPGAYGPREQAILEQLALLISPAVERDRLAIQCRQTAPTTSQQQVPAGLAGATVGGGDQPDRVLCRVAALSPREQCVLEHVARGSNNDQIAQALQVSTNTVKTHVSRILRKLRVSNRVQAALVVNTQAEDQR